MITFNALRTIKEGMDLLAQAFVTVRVVGTPPRTFDAVPFARVPVAWLLAGNALLPIELGLVKGAVNAVRKS